MSNLPPFVPGLQFGELFYREAVRPILDAFFPGLPYDAAIIGTGSEVLGLDTAMSADHSWLPYVHLYLTAEDCERYGASIRTTLSRHLPPRFRGFSTHFVSVPDEPGTYLPQPVAEGPVNHRVSVTHLASWVEEYTGWTMVAPPSLIDWLVIPEQLLLSLTAGRVYHSGLGDVQRMQAWLHYYPHDVWLYLLHAQWQRIAEEEPFVGRAGIASDETGSAVIAARLVRDIMRLCFLLERRYAPYAKHFGASFVRLVDAPVMQPLLHEVLQATSWHVREQALGAAYGNVAKRSNALRLFPPLPTEVSSFYDRPFQVIHGGRYADALWAAIEDEAVRQLPPGLGKVDQFVDSTTVLSHQARFRRLAGLYERY